jgi:hypothetical protein
MSNSAQPPLPDRTKPAPSTTVQSRQIEDAIARGLLVDVSPANSNKLSDGNQNNDNNNIERDLCSPISVLTEDSRHSNDRSNLMDLELWNDKGILEGGDQGEEEDSDDDLL